MPNDSELEKFRQEWKMEVLTKKMQSASLTKSTSADQLAEKGRPRSRTEIVSSSQEINKAQVAEEEKTDSVVIKKVENKDDPPNVRALNAYVEATRFERYLFC
jgi:hypothetical protein